MREIRFEVEGESVSGAVYDPPRGKPLGVIVLVHGFLSQRGEFADTGARLSERGWRVVAIDQRGFGASGGPRGRISAKRAIADVKGAFAWSEADYPGLPQGVIMHSMGTCFGLGAVATSPDIRAAVLAAPMSTVRAEVGELEFVGYKVARNVSNLAERIGLGSIKVPYKYKERHLFKDPEAVKRAQEAGFLGKKIDLANFNDLLEMDSREYAKHVRKPCLVILAKEDKAVKRSSSISVYDALAGDKELVELECGHSLWGDCEAAKAIEETDRWFRKHLLAHDPS